MQWTDCSTFYPLHLKIHSLPVWPSSMIYRSCIPITDRLRTRLSGRRPVLSTAEFDRRMFWLLEQCYNRSRKQLALHKNNIMQFPYSDGIRAGNYILHEKCGTSVQSPFDKFSTQIQNKTTFYSTAVLIEHCNLPFGIWHDNRYWHFLPSSHWWLVYCTRPSLLISTCHDQRDPLAH